MSGNKVYFKLGKILPLFTNTHNTFTVYFWAYIVSLNEDHNMETSKSFVQMFKDVIVVLIEIHPDNSIKIILNEQNITNDNEFYLKIVKNIIHRDHDINVIYYESKQKNEFHKHPTLPFNYDRARIMLQNLMVNNANIEFYR